MLKCSKKCGRWTALMIIDEYNTFLILSPPKNKRRQDGDNQS